MASRAAIGYRRLLKVSRIAFRNHDTAVLGAREELRKHFYKNKDVSDEAELGWLVTLTTLTLILTLTLTNPKPQPNPNPNPN